MTRPKTMPYLELFSKEQLEEIESVVASTDELFVQIYYPHSAGPGCAYFLRTFDQFKDLLSRQLWPEIEVAVFCERQYPIRGQFNEELLEKALQYIPEGEDFDVMDLEDLNGIYPDGLDSIGGGDSHAELKDDFSECCGQMVAIGRAIQYFDIRKQEAWGEKVITVHYRYEQWTFTHPRPNRLSCVGESPLDSAIYEGPEAVASVIAEGADVNAKDHWGRTTLHLAMALSFNSWAVTIVQELLKQGADPNAKDRYGRTPLFSVGILKSAPLLQLLLDNGADVNAVDIGGETAMDNAIQEQNSEAQQVLRAYGGKTKAELAADPDENAGLARRASPPSAIPSP